MNCDRCRKPTRVSIMSRFNTSMICMDCSDAERKLPEYDAAARVESEAVKRGDYNFAGVGFPRGSR